MIKTLSNIFKQDKEKFVIPRSVQQVIPIETIWSDGIFKIGRNKFARTYKFTDINYAVASKVDKETMFLEYMDLLNSFDCGGTTKITINNRRLNKVDFEKAKEVTQKDIKVVEESRRSGDPAVLIASSDKAKTVLGWKPEYDDLGTIIKTAWKWHSTHPNGYNK